jgi:hypothetical protein
MIGIALTLKKISYFCWLSIIISTLAACHTVPMSFGVPTKQFNQFTPKQKQAQIKQYNAEQKSKAEAAPLIHALEAIAGSVASKHPVHSGHCNQTTPKPVCHTNSDGSRTCTASRSNSCSAFGIE